MNLIAGKDQKAEVQCLCCGRRVPVTLMNGEWRRLYHHNSHGRTCSGSRMPVITETVLTKDKV